MNSGRILPHWFIEKCTFGMSLIQQTCRKVRLLNSLKKVLMFIGTCSKCSINNWKWTKISSREQWNRSNIFYSDDLETLSYIPITTLYFDRNQSVGPDDEIVTVLNVPLMAMAHSIIHDFNEIQSAINIFLELLQTELFVRVTVKQLMEGKKNLTW